MQLEDAQGKPVVWENCEVRAQVIGDAVLAGLENGNLADVTPYSSNSRKTFAGALVVYVKQTGNKDSSVMLTVKNAQGVELKCQMV